MNLSFFSGKMEITILVLISCSEARGNMRTHMGTLARAWHKISTEFTATVMMMMMVVVVMVTKILMKVKK